ncbi:uncharacterized protein V1513DRAFT_444566 [Lipomyces chichibuensis]|uniref:uncharacterized protein n=1 Tax=Lipomyces chichibuensis TaxID=1546026 RepID=UPI0033439392
MASAAVGGNPTAAIAAMMRKKFGGGDVDVALEAVTQPASSVKKESSDNGMERKLSHMTKGRAKGPKRRLPTTAPLPVNKSERQPMANKVKFAEPETTRSKPIAPEKPSVVPLSAKSHSFPSRSRSSLVNERLAIFTNSDSGHDARLKSLSTSVHKADKVATTTSEEFSSAKPKPATPAKPMFGTIKAGDKARPVSLIFSQQKSSIYERAIFVDDTARPQLTSKQRPVIPDKPKLHTLRGSSYSAVASIEKDGKDIRPLNEAQTFPQTFPNPKPKPESLLKKKSSFPISMITSAAVSKPTMSMPAPKSSAVKPTSITEIIGEKEKPVLPAKSVSAVKSAFESKEEAPGPSSQSWRPTGSPPKPVPARKPPIFHSRSKSYSGRSNVEKPILPPKPKLLFAKYNADKGDKLERESDIAVAHDDEIPAMAPASKSRPVSFTWGGQSAAATSEIRSEPKTPAMNPTPKPLLVAAGTPKPVIWPKPIATKPFKQEDEKPESHLKSQMSVLPSAPAEDSKKPTSSKPKAAGKTVVREPPILNLLPKPIMRETETVSVRDAVSKWGAPTATNTKGSTTISIMRAQTPLVL